MSPLAITLLMFGVLLLMMVLGIPIAFCLGSCALIFALIFWGPGSIDIVAVSTISIMQNVILGAIPLFILMANFLERSGIADGLYGLMYATLGRLKGGLAIGTVIICMIFAAMSGISAAATITMGLVALPSMFKRGYDKQIVMGCISAGGALGILIPPSVAMVLYCMLVGISVGRVFAGGVFPGILLGGMFIIYIAVRCQLNPKLGPPIPVEERVPLRSTLPLFKALILPTIVIVSVLGSIFTGMATATESAAVGAFGAMICAAVSRKLDWPMVRESCIATLKLTTLVLWLMIGASWFSSVWTATGGPGFVTTAVQSLGVNRWVIMCGMQLILIFLGCVMETTGILMVTVPVFFPIIKALGFDPVWFGVLFIVNMEMGFLTPPFGLNLFYMKAIVPKEITMQDIYRSIVPFVGLQFIGLVICLLFPQIVLWLPDIMVR